MTNQTAAASAIRPSAQIVTGDPRIRVKGLGKRYGALEVFRDINFEVAEREIVAVVGPSGCGKTTLLRCIGGLVAPTSGLVLIDGAAVDRPRPGVAIVFQHFGLLPWKTVAANVAFGLKVAGAPPLRPKRPGRTCSRQRFCCSVLQQSCRPRRFSTWCDCR